MNINFLNVITCSKFHLQMTISKNLCIFQNSYLTSETDFQLSLIHC